ncbi:similar to Saccharomyces cerevisiae YFR013W IOC3 Member of a complex (Isw1a) with Isw1p [Maudiozyma saulgeensis]|uniref:Similar to Saccharomyces cerevisiae YFR013W IOC3 Member of a complex (Isw1a) with Isw1p n=1 Tax=Maudiozyma saulgeensis TaxID=1789683 RepID=A0A1X7R175_9SACH|nr:similar to Saccharomyces cerevisiae YFR013W IOC3 Member of a complex (Isw1a) with Isw1p [Kazachstania saulgeensis]
MSDNITNSGTSGQSDKNNHTSMDPSANNIPQPDMNNVTNVSDTTNPAMDSTNLAELNSGLRRSSRVPKPRTDLTADLEDEYKKRTYKKRVKPKQKKHAANKDKKKKITKPSKKLKKTKATKKSATGKKITKKDEKKNNGKVKPTIETQEPSLTEANWAPCAPLLNSDFKTQQSVSSRLKNPNMKPVPYAGDVMKIMSFINKFYSLFDQDLLNLSFQDFEVGLDLYPGNSKESADGIYSEEKDRIVYYQDYILVKEVIQAQDKMNLLFLSLLQLLFVDPKKYDAPTLADLRGKNLYRPYIEKVRKPANEWGYPKEWRSNNVTSNVLGEGKFPLFPHNEAVPVVDPTHPEILTPNVYTYIGNDPVQLENDPLQTRDLEDEGILGLPTNDRIIFLRTLINWCSVQSLLVHHEIYQLSHFKRDAPFGIQTQNVPRYYLDGPEVTYNYFRKLCTIIQTRYEVRSKKKHYRKQMSDGKNPELSAKMKLLEEIKQELNNVEKSERPELVISLYDKWIRLFEGELNDNPLSNPFDDPIYTLRSQEFFIGRVPYMGDFYLPRLHSYGDTITMSTYTDLRKLQKLVSKFKNKEYTVLHLFEEYGQTLSSQFKVLYHDTPSLIHDISKNKNIEDKCYWHEMCHDAESLRKFLDFLDLKIVRPPPKEKKKDDATGVKDEDSLIIKENTSVDVSTVEGATTISLTDSESTKVDASPVTATSEVISQPKIHNRKLENSNINTNPLPRDQRYNTARNKLKILKEYLSDFYFILYTFEQLKKEYSDMKPGRRQLRDMKRNLINYNMDYDSDDMME